jgi:deoxyribonuclease-4
MITELSHTSSPCLLGAHFSIAGGLHRAMETARTLECPVAQIFTKNASTWKERTLSAAEIERFAEARAAAGVTSVASHTSYLINPAGPDDTKRTRSCRALRDELLRSAALGLHAVVLHPGAHMGSGVAAGIRRAAASLNSVFADTPPAPPRLLLETTAGQGSNLGRRFEELADILSRIDDPARVGVCLDTCHVFAAGYDVRTRAAFEATLQTFDRLIGLEHLHLIHFNDAKNPLGSRVDRHAHIGEGAIGLESFGFFMNDPRLQQIPKILETPKDRDGDRKNLTRLRQLMSP